MCPYFRIRGCGVVMFKVNYMILKSAKKWMKMIKFEFKVTNNATDMGLTLFCWFCVLMNVPMVNQLCVRLVFCWYCYTYSTMYNCNFHLYPVNWVFLFTFFNRGLDVQPKSLEKFVQNNDPDSAAILEIIFREEITHVAAGLRWFTWMCSHSNPPLVPVHSTRSFRIYIPNNENHDQTVFVCLSVHYY